MKKAILTMAMALMAAVVAQAAQDDLRLVFETKGPDCYKDATAVLDGEFYALVWVKAGATFGGFNADATLVDAEANELVAVVPFAKDGRLPATKKQLAAETAPHYTTGSFAVILLDTRNADGTLAVVAKDEVGRPFPAKVNGYSTLAVQTAESAAYSAALGIDAPIQIAAASAVPEGTPQPVITKVAMRQGPNGQEMVISVKGTVPYLDYTAAGADGSAVSASAAAGKANADDTIEIVVPAKGNMGLFKVIRKELID